MKQTFFIPLTILLSSISTILYGQEININIKYADSIQIWNYNLGKELHSVIIYNQAVKSFGYTDTIKIYKSKNNFYYYYGDSLITDLSYRHSNENGLVRISYSTSSDLTFLVSTTQQSLTSKFELVVIDASFDPNDLVYKLRNFSNDVLFGRYEERTKTGKILVTGQYCQIDSTYSDSLLIYNPETGEEIMEIIPRSKFPVKSGTWRYYTTEGIMSKEEKHINCT